MATAAARWIGTGVLAILLPFALAGATIPGRQSRTGLSNRVPFVSIVSQDARGLDLAVRIPASAFRIWSRDGETRVALNDSGSVHTPGHPELPVLVASIAVPLDAKVELHISDVRHTTLRIPSPVKPVGRTHIEVGSRPESDPAIYDRVDWWPEVRHELEVVQFRELRIARLLIHPVRYNPGASELELIESIDFRIDFISRSPLERPSDPASETLGRRLLNGASLGERSAGSTGRTKRSPAEPASLESASSEAPRRGVRLFVDEEGLISVRGDELLAAGYDLETVDPTRLELSFRGSPVPIRIVGEQDGRFDPEDRLEFYGLPRPTRFSSGSTYWLQESASAGRRFESRPAVPGTAPLRTNFIETVRYEEGNSIYTLGKPATEGDPHFFWIWFENNPNPPRVTEFVHRATLTGLDTSGADATLRSLFAGRTDPVDDPDHRIRFWLNGIRLTDQTWNGQGFHLAEETIPVSMLTTGRNTFKLQTLPLTGPDIVYLDWLEMDYPRLTVAVNDRLAITTEGPGILERYEVEGFDGVDDPVVLDVSRPTSPIQLTGAAISGSGPFTISFQDGRIEPGRYLVVGDAGRVSAAGIFVDSPNDLRSQALGADEIIIVPDGWEASIEPLAEHRRNQGLRVTVVSLTDVADEFASGNADDVAIKEFVAYAYEHWQRPAPTYLLLVGEPNMDPRNFLDRSPFQHLMPTHFGVTAITGETMTDTWFGAIAGDDLLPDLAVGRFSARTTDDVETIVQKILNYESNPPAGAAWSRRVLHIASDEVEFEDVLERAEDSLPEQFAVERQYRRSGATTGTIRSAFDDGALIASFIGHGNVTIWADARDGAYFDNTQVSALSNRARLPFVVALNCLNGWVAHPLSTTTLAEAFHNEAYDGSLAFWSPAGLGYLGDFEALQAILYRQIFENHLPYAGLAASNALVETFLSEPVSIDLVKEMIFLGDPAGWIASDSDGDLSLDHHERLQGTDPSDRDTDDDGLPDGLDGSPGSDSDADGIVDALDPDSDNDGLPDGLEMGLLVPDRDTDLLRGYFLPDADPGTTTDPSNADTDGGGSADGAEDRNADGRIEDTETDPAFGADDPVCPDGPPVEIAIQAAEHLRLETLGNDLLVSWGDASPRNPCVLYHVYRASGWDHDSGRTAFRLLGVTPQSFFLDREAGRGTGSARYVVVGSTYAAGEGVWGHYPE